MPLSTDLVQLGQLPKFDRSLIDEFFPFDTYRSGQRGCIEFVLDSFESGKRFVIVEAPTGSGKSPIGICVSRFFSSAYYITIQKILQSQIVRDFGSDRMVDLKGRATYPCNYYERFADLMIRSGLISSDKIQGMLDSEPNCNEGYCRKKDTKYSHPRCFLKERPEHMPLGLSGKFDGSLDSLPSGMEYSACPYYERLYRALNAHTCLMNFSSFLYQTRMSTRFGARDLMIVDETHQMEPQLLDFISISVNDKRLQNYGIRFERFETPEEYWIYFMEVDIVKKLASIVLDAQASEDIKAQDEYTSLIKKILAFTRCMEKEEEWVAEFEDGKGYSTVKLKPVFAYNQAAPYILNYGSRALLMSATILDVSVFCETLGISRSETASIRLKNRFPVENRPIRIRSAGRLTGGKAKMVEWGPKLLKKVDEVINDHPSDRGIVHTHNFAIADLLVERSKHRKRFLFQNKFPSKEKMLEVHATTPGSIIVAPAMHEGLDLVGDLSRFQIICKIPWANFFDDKQLARRVDLDRKYYVWLTALKLVQSYGRSVRSEDDYAVTYVVDGGFESFLLSAGKMIPAWFRDAVV